MSEKKVKPEPRRATPGAGARRLGHGGHSARTMGGVAKRGFTPNIKPVRRGLGGRGADRLDNIQDFQGRVKTQYKKAARPGWIQRGEVQTSFTAKKAVYRNPNAGILEARRDAGQLVRPKVARAAVAPKVCHAGEYLPEPDDVDNGGENQYRPISLPYPDIAEETCYLPRSADGKLIFDVSRAAAMKSDEPVVKVKPEPDVKGIKGEMKDEDTEDDLEEEDEVTRSAASSLAMHTEGKGSDARRWFAQPSSDEAMFGISSSEAGTPAKPLFFVQLPSHFPITQTSAKEQRGDGEVEESEAVKPAQRAEQVLLSQDNVNQAFSASADHSLRTLPDGRIGTLRRHKSGKFSLKMGDVIFQMARSTDTLFAQELVSVNANTGTFNQLGNVQRRMVGWLDVDSLL